LRLHSIYEQLQVKQVRLVNGQYLCAFTGNLFDKLPAGCKILKYNISEILSQEALSNPIIDLSIYNFEEEEKQETTFIKPEIEEEIFNEVAEHDYSCICGEGFDSIEELNVHRENCKEV